MKNKMKSMLKINSSILLFLFSLATLAQNKQLPVAKKNVTIPKLIYEIKHATHDSTIVSAYIAWNKNIKEKNLNLSTQLNLIIDSLCSKNLASDLSLKEKDFFIQNQAIALYNIGQNYYDKFDYDKSIEFFKKSLEIKKAIKDRKGAAKCLSNIGDTYFDKGELNTSIEYLFNALKMLDTLGDKTQLAATLLSIGNVFATKGDTIKGIDYFTKSLSCFEELKDEKGITSALYNLAVLQYLAGEEEKAFDNFQKTLVFGKKSNNKYLVGAAFVGIAGYYVHKKDYAKALEYYINSLAVSKELDNLSGMAVSQSNIGLVYEKMGNNKKSLEHYTTALSISKEIGEVDTQKDVLMKLSNNYQSMGNYKLALETYKEYITARDSLINEKSQTDILKKEYQYQTEKKEQELVLKNKNIELLNTEKKVKNYTLYGLIIGFILIITIAFLWFRNYKQKKNAKEIESNHALEMYMKEIDFLQENINRLISETPISLNTSIIIDETINQYLSTPLSERELVVLKELALRKTNKEIADSLFLSVNTIKTHLLNIYQKLDVQNRSQAIKKVNALRKQFSIY